MFNLDSLTRIEMFVSTFEYIVVYGSETALQLKRSLRVLVENLPKIILSACYKESEFRISQMCVNMLDELEC